MSKYTSEDSCDQSSLRFVYTKEAKSENSNCYRRHKSKKRISFLNALSSLFLGSKKRPGTTLNFPIKERRRGIQVMVALLFAGGLVACSNNSETTETDTAKVLPEDFELLSERTGDYSVLIVGESLDRDWDGWWGESGISNVQRLVWRGSLKKANQVYEILNLKEAPVFVVFDTEKIVFKTDKEEEMLEFLKNHESS